MAVVKRVCKESMLAAQEEVKNTPGYHRNGEVAMLRNIIIYLYCQCKLQSIALFKYSNYMGGFLLLLHLYACPSDLPFFVTTHLIPFHNDCKGRVYTFHNL